MTEKFTPGEWKVVSSGILGDYNGAYILRFIVDCFLPYGEPVILTEEAIQANAALISAAPDMYNELSRDCAICKLRDHETECEFCRIGKILKKARGKG